MKTSSEGSLDINERMRKVLSEVLKVIKPDEKEKSYVLSFANRILNEVSNAVKDVDVPHSVELHGSIAHDTWLSKDRDIDIFILLHEERPKEYLEKEILGKIEKALPYKFEKRYAEHPYLRAHIEDFEVDIVPGFFVNRIISAVDRTPRHTLFLKRHLNSHLCDEIRLLKAFLKGIKAYGAEIKVQGLSGYACELLVIGFGSFIGVLREFSYKPQIFLDFTNTWDPEEAKKFFRTRVIIIDPTDASRNVAASLNEQMFYRIKFASKMFLNNPRVDFFFPKEYHFDASWILKQLRDRAILLILLKKSSEVAPDTYWGQAKRIASKILNFMEKIPEIIMYAIETCESEEHIVILIETNKKTLTKFELLQGPPVWASYDNISEFINMHKEKIAGPWVSPNGKIMILVRRSMEKIDLKRILAGYLESIKMQPSFHSFQIIDKPEEILGFTTKENILRELIGFLIRRPSWLY